MLFRKLLRTMGLYKAQFISMIIMIALGIGLFLGYPPEDVCGFIENKADACKCVGCWKVYGDEDAAKKLFAKYKKCTDVYCTLFANGRSIERLTVAV